MSAPSERVRELFERACELEPSAREAFLDAECAGDAALLDSVRALLRADDAASAESFWGRSAIEHEARAGAIVPDAALGSRIGAYRLVEHIGAGGMGTVYRAVRDDEEFQHSVAVKRLHRGLTGPHFIARFRAERQILATLEHPNIARLVDGGSDDQGLPYLIMEFVDGRNLLAHAEANQLSVADRLRLFLPVCAAVYYAHQHMVIHRDLKPGNVLVTADGAPKLLDFGIAALIAADGASARSTLTAEIGPALTIRYASPEQVQGGRITTASDVYSLGVVLYELLTGQSPYRDPDRPATALMRAVSDEETIPAGAVRAELRGDIENILAKALKKAPEERYSSAEGLADDLRRHLAGQPVLARGDAWTYVAAKFVQRHTLLVTAVALIIASLVGGIVTTRIAQARADRRFEDVRRLARAVVFDYHDAIANLPGSTPVRERLVKDALAYLDSLAAEADSTDLQQELIDAYVRISKVQGNSYYSNLGDINGGLESSGKAIRAADALVTRAGDAASLFSAAQAYEANGDLLYAAGKLAEAETKFLRAIEFYTRAVALDPKSIKILVPYADVHRHLGDLYGAPGVQNMGRTDEAIALYEKAAALSERAVAEDPDNGAVRHQQYQMTYVIAGMQVTAGRPERAIDGYSRAIALIEAAAARRPDNLLDKQEMAYVTVRLGQLLMDLGRFEEAAPNVERSLTIMEGIAAADPGSTLHPRNLSVVRGHYARALRESGRFAEALAQNETALATFQRLSAGNPASVELKSDIAIGRRLLAETLTAMNRTADAVTQASASIAALDAIATDDDANLKTHRARGLVVRAGARAKAGDRAGAHADYAAAIAAFTELSTADPANESLKTELARATASRDAVTR